jgi:hypothetical protein
MHIFWIVYLVSLIVYVSVMSSTAYKLLLDPAGFIIFFAIALILFILVRLIQHRIFLGDAEIIYEEEPEPVLLTLIPEK